MKISIVHPSRSRPAQALATAKKWLSSAKNEANVEYWLSLDNDDQSNYGGFVDLKSSATLRILQNDNQNAIQAINAAAKRTTGNLLIVVSDDFCLAPFHWDAMLLKALEGKSDYCVKTDDGLQEWLITLPIMDRVYYERFGYIYNPVYNHMYSDTEMTCVAWMLGKYIKLDIRIPHHHYSTGKTPKDAVNEKADTTYHTGKKIFDFRKAQNFTLPQELITQPLPQLAGL